VSNNLLAGEQPIRVARQHWHIFIPPVALALVVWIVGGIVLKLLPGSVGSHDIGTIKLFVGLVLGVVMLGVLLVKYTRWRFTTYMLTNRRIIVSRGILSRYMESITLDRVQNISTSMGVFGRIFRSGNVEIESAGRDGNEVLARIQDPMGFSNAVEAAAEALRVGGYATPPPQAPPTAGPPAQAPAQYGVGEGYVPPGGQPGLGPPPGYQSPPRRTGGV
jgi:membrane protein YdbS with pleckstrin-like domain